MILALGFLVCVIISVVVIRLTMVMAGHFDILDHPGGHKQHDNSTPFVGGFGVIAVVLAVIYLGTMNYPDFALSPIQSIAAGASVLFVTGFIDDIWNLNFKIRFVIQALVAVSMVVLGNVELVSLGQIVPGIDVDLGVIAIPFTILATVGLINALNMIDGIDGLSGSLSFISLGGTAVVAWLAQNSIYLVFSVAVMGGVAGFLYYNLRYPTNRRARVFLGDNGSMLLGFVFAWLFIALSQGETPAMTPVTALWLFAIPLLDTVSVMLRRIWLGHSPFRADRNHLHHLFLRAGFRVSDTVMVVALCQLLLAVIGLTGMLLGVPEYLMFGAFLGVFAGYFYVIARPWRFVPNLRQLNRVLGLPSAHARGVFVGYFELQGSREVLATLKKELHTKYDYRVSLQEVSHKPNGRANIYALVEIDGGLDEVSVGEIRSLMTDIKSNLVGMPTVQVRLYMQRNNEHDRRAVKGGSKNQPADCKRKNDRRSPQINPAFYISTANNENAEPENSQV